MFPLASGCKKDLRPGRPGALTLRTQKNASCTKLQIPGEADQIFLQITVTQRFSALRKDESQGWLWTVPLAYVSLHLRALWPCS